MVTVLQLRLSIAETQGRNQRIFLEIEQMRVRLQEKKNAGLLAALLLGEMCAVVRNVELQAKQTELAIKERELFEYTIHNLHLRGNVTAAWRAADEARLQAAKQCSEQQQAGRGRCSSSH